MGDRADVVFENTQTLDGSGAVLFTSQGFGDHDLLIVGDGTLTVGPQLTIQGGRGAIRRSGAGSATLINQGPAKTHCQAGVAPRRQAPPACSGPPR